jgi:hypothetical protein
MCRKIFSVFKVHWALNIEMMSETFSVAAKQATPVTSEIGIHVITMYILLRTTYLEQCDAFWNFLPLPFQWDLRLSVVQQIGRMLIKFFYSNKIISS